MSKSKKILSLLLIMLFVISIIGATALADDINSGNSGSNDSEIITEAYDYPVRPGMKAWAEFDTRMEKIKACQIPESILSKMTTEALMDTVIEYPLLIDMVVRDTKQEGFDAILAVFNGLQEFVKRSDALFELNQYKKSLDAIQLKDDRTLVKAGYIEYLFVGIDPTVSNPPMPKYSMSSVDTPEGTSVTTYYGLTWSDHGTTAYLAGLYNDSLETAYPNATCLRNEYPSYNCHSYAWYSTSSTNPHWMDNPSAYMTDGSYTSGGAVTGSKVYYGSSADHSGRVVYVGGGSGANVGVYSKWGKYGLFSHNILDCPYTIGSYNCTFWN